MTHDEMFSKAAAFDRILKFATDNHWTTHTIPEYAATEIIKHTTLLHGLREESTLLSAQLREMYPDEEIDNPMTFAIEKIKVQNHWVEDGAKLLKFLAAYEKSVEVATKSVMPGEIAAEVIEHYRTEANNWEVAHELERENRLQLSAGMKERGIAKEEGVSIVDLVFKRLDAMQRAADDFNFTCRQQKEELAKMQEQMDLLVSMNSGLKSRYAKLFPEDNLDGILHDIVINKLKELQDTFKHLYKQRTEALEESSFHKQEASEWKAKTNQLEKELIDTSHSIAAMNNTIVKLCGALQSTAELLPKGNDAHAKI
jgi:hypothetical protein